MGFFEGFLFSIRINVSIQDCTCVLSTNDFIIVSFLYFLFMLQLATDPFLVCNQYNSDCVRNLNPDTYDHFFLDVRGAKALEIEQALTDCYLVDGSKKLLEGTELLSLTLNHQMAPPYVSIWGKVGINSGEVLQLTPATQWSQLSKLPQE